MESPWSYLYSEYIYHPKTFIGSRTCCPQEVRSGCHTYAIFLGDDDVVVSGCNAFREKGVPEGAILLVGSEEVAMTASTKVPSLRGSQRSKGFAVDVGLENRYWPAGSPPGSQIEEVHTRVVMLDCYASDYQAGWRDDNVTLQPPSRGYAKKGDNSGVTYWHAWVSEALLGTDFYKRMKVAEGIQRGYVTVLKTVEEAVEKCSAAGVEFKEQWVDMRVVNVLERRDLFCRLARVLAVYRRISKTSARPKESDDLFI